MDLHWNRSIYTQREVCAGDNVGVDCVKTLVLTWQTISEPWCVERDTSNPLDNAKAFRTALMRFAQ